jgi:hypothetical protein
VQTLRRLMLNVGMVFMMLTSPFESAC